MHKPFIKMTFRARPGNNSMKTINLFLLFEFLIQFPKFMPIFKSLPEGEEVFSQVLTTDRVTQILLHFSSPSILAIIISNLKLIWNILSKFSTQRLKICHTFSYFTYIFLNFTAESSKILYTRIVSSFIKIVSIGKV